MPPRRLMLAVTVILSAPAAALADFSLGEAPLAIQDRAMTWLFQILSVLLGGFLEALVSGLFPTA